MDFDKAKEIEDEKKNNGTENEKNEGRISIDGLTILELKDIFDKKRSESLLTDFSILLGQKNEQHFEVEQEKFPFEVVGGNIVDKELQEKLETAYKKGELTKTGEMFKHREQYIPGENIQEVKPLYLGKNAVNNRLQEELETAYKKGELKIVGECIRGYEKQKEELKKDPVYEFKNETYIRAILESQDELVLSNGEKLAKGNSCWFEAERMFSREVKAFAEQGLAAEPEVMKMIQQYLKEEQGRENNNENLSKE